MNSPKREFFIGKKSMEHLRPTQKLNKSEIESQYLQASRNLNGSIVGLYESGLGIGYQAPVLEQTCVQTKTGTCLGCPVYEDLLSRRLKRPEGTPAERIVARFSEEWCPTNAMAQLPPAENIRPYLARRLSVRISEGGVY
jgi:hypothetical protein